MIFKLGKRDPAPVGMRFGAYFNLDKLPTPPPVFGRPWLVPTWGMLGNDKFSDCVWAGAAHETTMLEADSAGARYLPESVLAIFTTANVLSDYSACTGFNSADHSTDRGTTVAEAADYRRKTGIIDFSGRRHLIDAYVGLTAGDLNELAFVVNEYGIAGVGVRLPDDAESQLVMGEVWNVTPGASISGGHYIPCIGRNRLGNYLFVSWGRLQAATPEWVQTYMDEGIAYLSRERLRNGGLSPQGLNLAKLEDDFKQLTG